MTAVFGYGSLIFKPPPFANLTSEAGYIQGFVRRFAQDSHDHRGTEENPGRVVTLVTESDWESHRKDEPVESNHVWGRVYRIPPESAVEIWEYLDHREKDGYTMRTVDVRGIVDGEDVVIEKDCRVYVGETHNSSFGGGTPMNELADRIATSVGPSGANKDYLYDLCDGMRQMCPGNEDAYLTMLERLVRERDAEIQREGLEKV